MGVGVFSTLTTVSPQPLGEDTIAERGVLFGVSGVGLHTTIPQCDSRLPLGARGREICLSLSDGVSLKRQSEKEREREREREKERKRKRESERENGGATLVLPAPEVLQETIHLFLSAHALEAGQQVL